MKITSVNNEKVKMWSKLRMKKYRDIEHLFLVEGPNLVEEALKKGIVCEVITTDEKLTFDVPVYYVNNEVMQKISTLLNAQSIAAVCKYIMPDDIKGNVIILDHIQDPGNLGTIIRSAVAFNFETVIVSNDSVDFYNDKVIRASEGMFFHVNLIKDDLISIIPLLKNKGYKIIGTDVVKGEDIRTFTNSLNAYVIGNEGNGLSVETKEICDDFVYIPISKTCESLNASVAASIIMYEDSK